MYGIITVKHPLVSICIPTYNYGRYIGEAIESVLGQDFDDCEIIIIDDCSDDETSNIITRYIKTSTLIKYFRNERNVGMVNNWNLCLEAAKGKYIQFLFADDKLCASDSIRTMYASLEANKEAVMVCSARLVIDDKSKPTGTWSCFKNDALVLGHEMIYQCLLEQRNIIGEPTAVMFRKEKGQRGFDPSYRQLVDLEMWLYLLSTGDLVYINKPLVAFRQHEKQQSQVNSQTNVPLHEMAMLTTRYFINTSLLDTILIKPVIDYGYVYKVWKSRRDGKTIPIEKSISILDQKQRKRFYLTMPLYKIVNPILKILIKARRGKITRKILLANDC